MSPRTERLLERARALVAEPNNMDVRTRFLAATFNIDRLAAVLVEIDQSRSQGDADGSQVEPSTTGAGRHIPSTPPFIQWNGGENPAPGKVANLQVGRPVEVAPGYRYPEWQRVPLWVCGVHVAPVTGEVSYDVSEAWPPKDFGDCTTDFKPEDLVDRIIPTDDQGGEGT